MMFRAATAADVPAIVALLADDPLGAARETAPISTCLAAFADIVATRMHQLIVAEAQGRIVATAQLTLLHGLWRGGMVRCLVEAVRVAADQRSRGVGAALMAECDAQARAAGAGVLQLTANKTCQNAHRFYERLRFIANHPGMKKDLT